MPGQREPSYGKRGVNRTGAAVTVLLHVLLVLVWILQPPKDKKAAPPSGADMVYIEPVKSGKPKPKEARAATPKPVSSEKSASSACGRPSRRLLRH